MWWEYLMENAVWSIGGLFVGYHLGRTERAVQELIQRQDEDHGDDDT